MNNLIDYELYFKQISESYTKLKGFYHIDLFDFQNFLNDLRGEKFKTPLLILESYNTNTLYNGLYNINDVHHGAFTVLGNFDIKTLNPEKKTLFLSELEEITKQILTKMLMDKRSSQLNPMNGLIPESISISRTETVAGSFQGFRMEFTIETENEIKLSQEWI